MSPDIIFCIVLLVLAIVSPFCSPFFRRPRLEPVQSEADGEPTGAEQSPKVSVIIAAHDNAVELERHLPLLLEQRFAQPYEVIVVDESSTDDTDDILTRLKASHSNLYTTFMPSTSHYISRRKMALTLGVKAAKGEWLVFTDADCRPADDGWLEALSRHFSPSVDLVLGHGNYAPAASLTQRFLRFQTQCYALRTAQRSTAYRHWGCSVAVRRTVFEAAGGFTANRSLLRGEWDFMVNELAQPQRTAIAIEPAAQMQQLEPTRKSWRNIRLSYMETRRHLRRSAKWRSLFAIDQTMLHANALAVVAAIAYAIVGHSLLVAIAAAVAIAVALTLRLIMARRALSTLHESLPLWPIPMLELTVLWRNALSLLRHRRASKYEFTVHGAAV